MKIVLPDGRVIRRRLCASTATGYVAKKLVLRNDDVTELGRLAARNPMELRAVVLQLAARLQENRAPLLTRRV